MQAFDHPRPGADTAVIPRKHNPARMQAMYQVGNTGETAYSTNVRMGLPPPPHHKLVDKHPTIAPAILRKFEGDVQQMERPVKNLEGRLEQALARMHARRAHKQALHLYNTDTEEWRDLSRKAEHEREKRVAQAATESRELVGTMNSAMQHANNEMRAEMRDTTNAMKGELEDVVHKFAAEGRGKVSKADSEAIAQTQVRQAEMEKVMGEYVAHERDENHKLQNEMRDLVAQSERGKADVIAEAERWKHDEEAKYKHEMEAQVEILKSQLPPF
jgi:CRP-like cAMP-binding protein